MTVVSSAALSTHDLAVGYRTRRSRRVVLDGVTLSVAPGALICLLGPNGSGKSTLLKTLAGMQALLRGSVEIGGVPVASMSASDLARRLGVVLTDRVTVDALTARRVVELGRYPHTGWLGRMEAHDHAVVSWAIDAVRARHLADQDIARLSDGERQRVMIARALAQEPVVLLLDEPTAFLDVPARVEVMSLLRRLTQQTPLAAVVSTHDLDLALRTADIVWLILPGGEVVTGTPEDVVRSGGIARAFDGPYLRFEPADRSFRWLTGGGNAADDRGAGVPQGGTP